MTIPIDFLHRYRWGSRGNNRSNRPYSEIFVYGPLGSYDLFALVDTGADYTQLDESIGKYLGISLTGSNASSHAVGYGNGTTSQMTLVSNVKIEIEGNSIRTDVLFGQGIPALLGRLAIVNAIELGMDDQGWLYR